MTRRRALLKEVRKFARANGLDLKLVEGASHTKIFLGPRRSVVPRHTELNEITVRNIRHQLGMNR